MKKIVLLRKSCLSLALLVMVLLLQIQAFADPFNVDEDPSVFDQDSVDAGVWNAVDSTDVWKDVPAHTYYTEGGATELSEREFNRDTLWLLTNLYCSGHGSYRFYDTYHDRYYSSQTWGMRTIIGSRCWSDDDVNFTLKSEKSSADSDEVIYSAQASYGDTIQVFAEDYRSATANRLENPLIAKNAGDYQREWDIPPSEAWSFYTNIRPVRRNGKWIDNAEDYTWPPESGDGACSIWQYTVQEGDELIYADVLADIHVEIGAVANAPDAVDKTRRDIKIRYRFEYVVTDSGFIKQEVKHDAESNPGEDGGTEIISEIIKPKKPEKPQESKPGSGNNNSGNSGSGGAGGSSGNGSTGGSTGGKDNDIAGVAAVSVAGAIAAAGAAGGAGVAGSSGETGQNSKQQEDEDKKKRYKMYVYKTFGDAIQKGAKPVRVYARISQIIEGKEYDCTEWTEKIQAYGENLDVRPAGTEGVYKAFEAGTAAENRADKGTVVFTLTGPGGMIRNKVTFRLVGDPKIVFPRILEDGVSLDVGADLSTVQMVAGKGGYEELCFTFLDATEEPKSVRFVDANGFHIEPKKHPKLAFTYYACIENQTEPLVKENEVFADTQNMEITIEGTFSDKKIVRGSFTVELYPQGLSVLINAGPNKLRSPVPGMPQLLKDSHIEVISYATRDEEILSLDPVIPSTDFDLCFAIVKEDKKALIAREPKYFTLDKLEETDEPTKNILAKYQIETGWHMNGFALRPGNSIPEMRGKYYVELPVSASAEGYTEEIRIPLRLIGEPFDPRKGWEAEFKGLCNTVIRYYPAEYAHSHIQYIREHFSDPAIWDASQLRIMRYDVIEGAQEFWAGQYKAAMWQIEYYDLTEKIFKKPPRFLADKAFSILAKYYLGENENWISPLKDLIVDIVDEAIWNYAYSGSCDVDIIDKIMEQGANALENCLSVEDASAALSTGEQKKLFTVLVFYILADWGKNYFSMDPKDFWESWRSTWFDLTGVALKKIVGAGLERGMKSKAVNKFFNTKLMSKVNEYLPGAAKGQFTKPGAAGDPKLFKNIGNVDNTLIRDDKVWTATHRPSGKEMFINLQDMEFLGYREVVNKALEELFGFGIALLVDNAKETVADDGYWRGIVFPVDLRFLGIDGDYEDLLVKIDVAGFFNSETGLSSKAFEMLFETLFGPVANLVHVVQTSSDPAKEIVVTE